MQTVNMSETTRAIFSIPELEFPKQQRDVQNAFLVNLKKTLSDKPSLIFKPEEIQGMVQELSTTTRTVVKDNSTTWSLGALITTSLVMLLLVVGATLVVGLLVHHRLRDQTKGAQQLQRAHIGVGQDHMTLVERMRHAEVNS